MKIYEIDAEIEACVDNETGEIIDEARLDSLLMERNVKIEGVGLWIKNLESFAKGIKEEENTLKKRRESAEKKAESLRQWLSNAVGYKKFETPRISISFRSSTETVTDDELVPKKWCVKKIIYKPDKKAIKAALLEGKKIKDASLAEHQNIQIK